MNMQKLDVFQSKGSLSGWKESDYITEMTTQREAMSSTATTQEERTSVCSTAVLMVFCVPECFKDTVNAHRDEMELRNNMINQAEFFTDRESKEPDSDPNACKNCGTNDDYANCAGHIYCQSCGQDFDIPHLNWL